MNNSYLLCGVGGQGTVLAAKVLASAAIKKGEDVKTTETIGMAQRGGSVVSHVRTGSNVHSPLIHMKGADVIIGFEPAEVVRNIGYLKDNGTIIISNKAVKPVTASLTGSTYDGCEMIDYLQNHYSNVIVIDTDDLCSRCGSEKVLNVILLGAAAASGALDIDFEELKNALLERLPEKFHELNIKALELAKDSVTM